MSYRIEIYPADQVLRAKGVTIEGAAVTALLPAPLQQAARVLVDPAGSVLVGIPAAPSDADGAAIRAALDASPAFASALSAYDASAAAGREAGQVAALANLTKAECGRRIFAVLKDDRTQLNITGLSVDLVNIKVDGGTLSAEDEAVLTMAAAIKAWVAAMQAKRRELAAAGDLTFALDTHWPAPPAGAAQFAARF